MIPVLKFTTYFKPVIWGGEKIALFKGIPSQGSDIGESWEISPMPGHESVVADGPFKGETINSLVSRFSDEILGKKGNSRWHGQFRLLVKFIDSNHDLSIQVHPNDKLADQRHGCLGKTEMWYSLAAAPGAYLYSGFNRKMDAATFQRLIQENSIVDALGKHLVKKGDIFYIPSGRVHALGKGNFVVEIQEASDITYRIYDYDRRDALGNPRQLHVDQSIQAVNYDDIIEGGQKNVIPAKGSVANLIDCPYFTTEVMDVDAHATIDIASLDSFLILISIAGSLTVTTDDGQSTPLPQGQTLLVPAIIPSIRLDGTGQLLTVHL